MINRGVGLPERICLASRTAPSLWLRPSCGSSRRHKQPTPCPRPPEEDKGQRGEQSLWASESRWVKKEKSYWARVDEGGCNNSSHVIVGESGR